MLNKHVFAMQINYAKAAFLFNYCVKNKHKHLNIPFTTKAKPIQLV